VDFVKQNIDCVGKMFESFVQLVIFVFIALCLYNYETFIYKTKLTLQGIVYLLFCNDKGYKKGKIAEDLFKSDKVEKKTVIFVRHGESTWNDTFNKGSHRSTAQFIIGYIPGLIKAICYEIYLLVTGRMDSWFYDSPLSYLGLGQVDQLNAFISKEPVGVTKKEEELIKILRGDTKVPPSKIVCSSLRRALSTMAGGFQFRLKNNPDEKILVHPSLQEISRNPDTLSITPKFTQVTASWIDKDSTICDFQTIFNKQLDMTKHFGNKPLDTNGLKRMNSFCDFVFSADVEEDYVIAGGHSIWFRSFFRAFLPETSTHVSKKRKVVNTGCVAFTLMKATTPNGTIEYMIDESSISVIFLGF